MNQQKLHRTIEHVVSLLAREAYAELETLSRGVRLQAGDMKDAVEGYGRRIVPLPAAGYRELDIVEVAGVEPRQWSVFVPLYIEGAGRSDLTLALTLAESDSPLYGVEIDDIHVL